MKTKDLAKYLRVSVEYLRGAMKQGDSNCLYVCDSIGSGNARTFTIDEAVKVCVLVELHRAGMKPEKLRRLNKHIVCKPFTDYTCVDLSKGVTAMIRTKEHRRALCKINH